MLWLTGGQDFVYDVVTLPLIIVSIKVTTHSNSTLNLQHFPKVLADVAGMGSR